MELSKEEKLCCLIIDTHGSPDVAQVIECGYSEGMAVEFIMRLTSRSIPADQLVRNAARILHDQYHVVAYMGRYMTSWMRFNKEGGCP